MISKGRGGLHAFSRRGIFFYSCLRVKGNYANISYNLNIVLATAVSNRCEHSQLKHCSGLGISGGGGAEPHVLSAMCS